MKGLINLKNKDIECFKWCHIRFINPQNKDPDRIKKQGKKNKWTISYTESLSVLPSNSLSIFASIFSKSESKSNSESDFNSVFIRR